MRTIIIKNTHSNDATQMKQALASILPKFCKQAFSVRVLFILTFLAPAAGLLAFDARAADGAITITIQDHRFEPAQLEVPAGKKLTLVVKNLDPTPEEFESHDLKREKIVPAKGQVTIAIGPLKPGVYKFVGEYHEKTAQGQLLAK
jgi:plastocyanin